MQNYAWLVLALLSAVAAALVSVLAKIGMEDVNPNLATVLRGIAFALVLVIFGTVINVWPKLRGIGAFPLWMILLSGIAGAASWVFYFNALKLADVSRVAPIDKLSLPFTVLLAVPLLRERPTALNWAGIALIAVGAYMATVRPHP